MTRPTYVQGPTASVRKNPIVSEETANAACEICSEVACTAMNIGLKVLVKATLHGRVAKAANHKIDRVTKKAEELSVRMGKEAIHKCYAKKPPENPTPIRLPKKRRKK